MKQTFFGRFYVIVMLLLLFGVQSSFAKRVSVEEARAKASAFWGKKINTPSKRKMYSANATTQAYYVFNDEKDGFVIISGDDAVSTPVLGYSFTGHFDVDAIPEGLRELLNDYERQILAMNADENSAATPQTKASFVGEKKIETAKWDQDVPYNTYCPANCPTGCVATATAIVMRHYGYPSQGRGSNSYVVPYTGETLSADFSKSYYDWGSMPMENANENNKTRYDGVARLMSDIGIAVEMMYHPDGSSAFTSAARQALVEYFSYSPKARILRADNFDPEEWKEKLRNEIDNDRLIMYDGQSTKGGHAFVVDGYKDDLFSVNWGWGGWYNGYFSLGNLQPSEEYAAYNSDQSALINIMPSDGTEDVFSQLVLRKDAYGFFGFVSNTTNVKSGQSFSIQTGQVINSGKNDFDGELCVALFDKNGVQKEVISTYSIQGLGLNYYFSLSFTCQPSVDAVDGDYIALVSKMADSEEYLLVGDEDMNVFKIPATNHIPMTANISFDLGKGVTVEPFSPWNNYMYDSKPVIGSDFYFRVSVPENSVKVMVKHKDEILYSASTDGTIYKIKAMEDATIVIRAYSESDLIPKLAVHVNEPGTLEEQLEGYDCDAIKSIVVSGNIDQRDFVFLNKFFTDIDLSATTIVAYDKYSANSIPANAFAYNSNLTRFVMPAGITSISNNAFMQTSLTEITIPKGVSQYGLNVFNYCRQLKEVTVLNPQPAFINWCVLIGTLRDQGGTLHVPTGSKTAYESAEEWSMFTNIVEDAVDIYTDSNELVSSANLEGYKTFYDAENNYQVDENTTIYKVTAANDAIVTLTEVEGQIIPKGEPVILKTTDAVDYKLTLVLTSEEATGDWDDNLLKASDGNATGKYVLAYTDKDGLGFYQYNPALAAGSVYVEASASAKGRLSVSIGTEGTTSIMEVESTDATQENVYNVAGQKVNAAYKGIVIKNGKKYLNK